MKLLRQTARVFVGFTSLLAPLIALWGALMLLAVLATRQVRAVPQGAMSEELKGD